MTSEITLGLSCRSGRDTRLPEQIHRAAVMTVIESSEAGDRHQIDMTDSLLSWLVMTALHPGLREKEGREEKIMK